MRHGTTTRACASNHQAASSWHAGLHSTQSVSY